MEDTRVQVCQAAPPMVPYHVEAECSRGGLMACVATRIPWVPHTVAQDALVPACTQDITYSLDNGGGWGV